MAKSICYFCRKPIQRGGITREGKTFHKACYGRYKAMPRRVPKGTVYKEVAICQKR